MARIAGVNIPTNKRVTIGLRYIYGIGPTKAAAICQQLSIPDDRRVKGLVVTPAGLELRDRIRQEVLGHAPLLAVLSLEERIQLRDQLKRVVEANAASSMAQPA